MHTLDGGRFVVRGNRVHKFVVAFVREAIEAGAALLPEEVGVEDGAEADIQLVEQRVARRLRDERVEVPVSPS